MTMLNRWGQQNPLMRRVRQHGALSTLFRAAGPAAAPLRNGSANFVLGEMPAALPALLTPQTPTVYVDDPAAEVSAWQGHDRGQATLVDHSPRATLPTLMPSLMPSIQRAIDVAVDTLPSVMPLPTRSGQPQMAIDPVQMNQPAPVAIVSTTRPLLGVTTPPAVAPSFVPTGTVARTQSGTVPQAVSQVVGQALRPMSGPEQQQRVAPSLVNAQPLPIQRQPVAQITAPTLVATSRPAGVGVGQAAQPSAPVQEQSRTDSSSPTGAPLVAPVAPVAPAVTPTTGGASAVDDPTWSRLQVAFRKAKAQTAGDPARSTPAAAPPARTQPSLPAAPALQRQTDQGAPRRTMISEQPTNRSRPGDNAPADLTSVVDAPTALPTATQITGGSITPTEASEPGAMEERVAVPLYRSAVAPSEQPQRQDTPPPIQRLAETANAPSQVASVLPVTDRQEIETGVPATPQQTQTTAAAGVTTAAHAVALPRLAANPANAAAVALLPSNAQPSATMTSLASPPMPADVAEVDPREFIAERGAVSLEAAWPVQRLIDPAPESIANMNDMNRELHHAPPARDIAPPFLQEVVRRQLERSQTARPTEAKVDVIMPRRPRPVPRPTAQSESTLTTPALAAVQRSTTDGSGVDQPIEETLTARLIPTQIGALPADLWTLVGATPPPMISQPVADAMQPPATIGSFQSHPPRVQTAALSTGEVPVQASRQQGAPLEQSEGWDKVAPVTQINPVPGVASTSLPRDLQPARAASVAAFALGADAIKSHEAVTNAASSMEQSAETPTLQSSSVTLPDTVTQPERPLSGSPIDLPVQRVVTAAAMQLDSTLPPSLPGSAFDHVPEQTGPIQRVLADFPVSPASAAPLSMPVVGQVAPVVQRQAGDSVPAVASVAENGAGTGAQNQTGVTSGKKKRRKRSTPTN